MEMRQGQYKGGHVFRHGASVLKGFCLLLLAIPFFWVVNQCRCVNCFPIQTVRIYGIDRLDKNEIQSLLLPLVGRGFFYVDIERIKERLLQLPWVSSLFVRKMWPDQIHIIITEKKPVAYWNEHAVLSETGELFSPPSSSISVALPLLIGSNGQQLFMLERFKQLNRLLIPLHAKITYLELTPYSSWKLKLNNGMKIQMNHKDILTRLDQFVKVYPQVIGTHPDNVDYVDLSYSNGMAVRWKKQMAA